MADASAAPSPSSSSSEVPLVATAGPTGKAATLRIVKLALRYTSLALFLSGGLLATVFKTPGASVAIGLGTVGAGIVLSLLRTLTIDRYVARRIGRADVFADKVVIYKNEIVYEVEWRKVKNLVAKPDYIALYRTGDFGASTTTAIPCGDPETASAIIEIWRQYRRPDAPPPTRPAAPGGERLLVASGGGSWKKTKGWINFGLVVIYMTALFRDNIRRSWFPQMPRYTTGHWEIDFLILIVSYRIIRGWLMRFANARIGRAEFFPDAIKFFSGDDATTVQWSDVTGFDDGSADFVRVLRRGAKLGEWLSVPTPSEELRVRVLDLLEEKGIPRADAAGLVS